MHSTGEILDLYLAGLAEPIGTTPNHRFWSADRQAFLPASDLQPHEQLLLADGTHATLSRSEPRPGRTQVFNLEVDQEHVYYVSQLGTLVHNAYPLEREGGLQAVGKLFIEDPIKISWIP